MYWTQMFWWTGELVRDAPPTPTCSVVSATLANTLLGHNIHVPLIGAVSLLDTSQLLRSFPSCTHCALNSYISDNVRVSRPI